MNILDLPPEVIANILSRLPWQDLLSTSTVCRNLNEALQSSSQLQYTISLGCAGLEENCACPACNALSFPEREARLLRLTHSWTAGTVQRHDTLVSPNGADWSDELYDLDGGFLVRCLPPRSIATSVLEVIKLPSVVHALEMEKKEYHLHFAVQALAVNAAADVIALVTWPDQQHGQISTTAIHLKSLSDMTDYLAASDSLISHKFPKAQPWAPVSLQFFGNILVANFESKGDELFLCLVFWHWRNGTVLGEMEADMEDMTSFSGVSMITESTFIVPDLVNNCIHVFELQPGHDPFLMASFLLPVTGDNIFHGSMDCTFRIPSIPLHPTLGSLGPTPFRIADHDSQVITLTIPLREDSRVVRQTLVYLVAPIWPFLTDYSSSLEPPDVPWEEWGPMHTRMFPYQSLPLNPFSAFTSGSRVALLGERRHDTGGVEQDIHVFDFNEWELRRSKLAMEGGTYPGPTIDVERSTTGWSPSTLRGGIWHNGDITTSLPYKCTIITVQGRYDALMIDEERILAFRAEAGMGETLTVMQVGPPEITSSRSDDKVWIDSRAPVFAAIQDTPFYVS